MNILLADDHPMMRQGLRSCLAEEPDLRVVGEAADGLTAVRLADELRPDLIVMDISMPQINGIDATRRVLAHPHHRPRVLVLSMHCQREFVLEALAAGAAGYLLKSSAFDELLRAIHAVAGGQTYLSPAIAGYLVEGALGKSAAAPGPADSPAAVLSPRELQVLRYLADGDDAKRIGQHLKISFKTVHTFRTRIMRKLEIDSLPELTKFAIRAGIVSLRD